MINLSKIMGQFTIKAPSAGMLIYDREWNGKKKGVGAQWNAWNPTVATLPDLTQMESATYINEVDVRKIVVGQKVEIALDADPTKKLQGTVTQVLRDAVSVHGPTRERFQDKHLQRALDQLAIRPLFLSSHRRLIGICARIVRLSPKAQQPQSDHEA